MKFLAIAALMGVLLGCDEDRVAEFATKEAARLARMKSACESAGFLAKPEFGFHGQTLHYECVQRGEPR